MLEINDIQLFTFAIHFKQKLKDIERFYRGNDENNSAYMAIYPI